jgi:hypothetical protein
MDYIKFKAHVGDDGILKLQVPVGVVNQDLEVLVVIQPQESEVVDELGWPIGYFDETYGSLADDPIERDIKVAR